MAIYNRRNSSNFELSSAPGGDLQTLIDGDLVPLEGDVVHFVRQLVEGLAYLHQRNIAHLDIKVSSTHKRSKRTCHASRISGSRNRLRSASRHPIVPTISSSQSRNRTRVFSKFSVSIAEEFIEFDRRSAILQSGNTARNKSIPRTRDKFRMSVRWMNHDLFI